MCLGWDTEWDVCPFRQERKLWVIFEIRKWGGGYRPGGIILKLVP